MSCENKVEEVKKERIISNEEKVLNYVSGLFNNKELKSVAINELIDSIQIVGEINVIDSLNKSIYLGISPKNKSDIYSRLENHFNKEFGKVHCKETFCTWKKQPDKKSTIEVMLMDESIEKKQSYYALEIEETHER